jgi:hypothetical protein
MYQGSGGKKIATIATRIATVLLFGGPKAVPSDWNQAAIICLAVRAKRGYSG